MEEAHRIERSFRFRNLCEPLTFVQEIGELAEAEGHRPNISFGWGNATISLQTKKIKGLHKVLHHGRQDCPHICSDGHEWWLPALRPFLVSAFFDVQQIDAAMR